MYLGSLAYMEEAVATKDIIGDQALVSGTLMFPPELISDHTNLGAGRNLVFCTIA